MEQHRSETNDRTVFYKNECIGPFYITSQFAMLREKCNWVPETDILFHFGSSEIDIIHTKNVILFVEISYFQIKTFIVTKSMCIFDIYGKN